VILGITYFSNSFKDLIDWDPSKGYINIRRAETEGIEINGTFRPIESLIISANYTYTDTEDKDTGEKLLRRPTHKGSLNILYKFLDKGNINLDINFVGKRDDWTPYPKRGELGDYALVNMAVSYDIHQNLQIFSRIENLFDRDYEDVWGYGTAGFSFFGGLKLSF
jgi:vitamin B12 transporter